MMKNVLKCLYILCNETKLRGSKNNNKQFFNFCLISFNSCRMDYTKWNTVAKGEERTMKRISELELGRLYEIENIRKTSTKYGDKVTVGLEGKIFCYLPAKLSEALLENDGAGLLEFEVELQNVTVRLRRLPARGRFNPVEFVRDLPGLDDLENE